MSHGWYKAIPALESRRHNILSSKFSVHRSKSLSSCALQVFHKGYNESLKSVLERMTEIAIQTKIDHYLIKQGRSKRGDYGP